MMQAMAAWQQAIGMGILVILIVLAALIGISLGLSGRGGRK